jgi:hypothetical protein
MYGQDQSRSTGYPVQMLANKTIPNEVTAPSRPRMLHTMTCQMQPNCCRCYLPDDAGSRAMQMPINNGALPKPWLSLTQPSLNCCRAPAARPTYPTLPTTNYLHEQKHTSICTVRTPHFKCCTPAMHMQQFSAPYIFFSPPKAASRKPAEQSLQGLLPTYCLQRCSSQPCGSSAPG